ncbi:isochorismatase family protein [Nostoc sp. KVJ3]|uniref:cysteine hydrolase n=1 Tax=Nostoc sp. KVJ3 TaxID=457945 RepID=UPI002237FA48|nr:cysteine hydrolase [Nostoc sp. KVJ3]MCW5312710.1 isochorismatase family protein [Nostoc sp. KVJ3]
MSFCLFVIDIQNGFISENTKHIIQRIKSLLDQDIFEYVIFTRFINSFESPYVKYLNWYGLLSEIDQRIVSEIEPFVNKVFDKTIYTACNVETITFIKERNIQTIFVCGIDSEACVLKTAVDFFESNIRSYFLEYYSASNGGDNCQKAAILVLSQLIGVNHIITEPINRNNFNKYLC